MGGSPEDSARRNLPCALRLGGNVRLNAEALIALAGAHGIDLVHVAGSAIRTEGIASQRPRTQLERKLGIEVRETAAGRETRNYRRPNWSLAELVQAAAAGGVHGVQSWALRYSVAGDGSCLDELHSALASQAHRIAKRESWPPQMMSLDASRRVPREACRTGPPRRSSSPLLRRRAGALCGLPRRIGRRLGTGRARPIRSLSQKDASWIDIACAGIRRGIRGE